MYGLWYSERQSTCYSPGFLVSPKEEGVTLAVMNCVAPKIGFTELTQSQPVITTPVITTKIVLNAETNVVQATAAIFVPLGTSSPFSGLSTTTAATLPTDVVHNTPVAEKLHQSEIKIGLGVAFGTLLLILLVLGVLLWRAKRNKKGTEEPADKLLGHEDRDSVHTRASVAGLGDGRGVELESRQAPVELASRTFFAELGTNKKGVELEGSSRLPVSIETEPVELPAEVPEWPHVLRQKNSFVSFSSSLDNDANLQAHDAAVVSPLPMISKTK